MTERVRQVVRQTKARVFQGITKYPHKIVSLFEPHTEIIRKGKASKPNELGKMVEVQEAENQVITHSKYSLNVQRIPVCWFLRWNNTSVGSDSHLDFHRWTRLRFDP